MVRVAGRRASWAVLAGLSSLVVAQACTQGGLDTALDSLIDEVLAAVGPQVVEPGLVEFQQALVVLDQELADWQALGGEPVEARDAWVQAMLAWQRVETWQIGPTGSSLSVLAGEDRRDEIYSWPTVNTCRVDQETTEQAWDEASFFEDNLVNSYGLDALEYLLWASPEHTCPSQVDLDGAWDELGPQGVLEARQAFAVALSAQLSKEAAELSARWEDGFSEDLRAASEGGPYESQREALDEVFAAMFYLDPMTKDRKLGLPLGLDGEPEPEQVEGLHSGQGAAFVAANLQGFSALFSGGEGMGLDDLLEDAGHGDLADQVLAAASAAEASALAIELPLDEQIAQDAAPVQELYEQVDVVTDLLEGDVATVLTLTVPSEAAGDND
jgi:predicted lipoprotein